MTTFTKHFDNDIQDWIETPGEQMLVDNVCKMDVKKLDDLLEKMNQEARVDPSAEHSHSFRVTAKAMMRRYQEFKRNGVCREVQVGPPLTIGSMALAGLQGAIAGTIIGSIWGNYSNRD